MTNHGYVEAAVQEEKAGWRESTLLPNKLYSVYTVMMFRVRQWERFCDVMGDTFSMLQLFLEHSKA